MFFFRPGSNFCTLRNPRIAHSPKDFAAFRWSRYLSTVHLVLTRDVLAAPKRLESPFRLSGHPMTMRNAPGLHPGPRFRYKASLAFASLLYLTLSLDAYEVPLAPTALHDAWTLGQRNDQATAEFLAPYSRPIAAGEPSSPHVAEIELLTPFAQVVDQSRQNLSNYTEPQASQAYRQRGETVIVRIRLMLPAAFPKSGRDSQNPPATRAQTAPLRPENFWQSFQFTVKQGQKVLTARSIQNKPVYSAATDSAPSTLDGQTVWLEFEARAVASDEITVEVTTPDARTVSTTFDLKKLR
jgi:hypothetical protein